MDDFDMAVATFDEASRDLRRAALPDGFDARPMARAADLAADLLAVARLLRPSHLAAVDAYVNREREVTAAARRDPDINLDVFRLQMWFDKARRESNDLKFAYKTLFLFGRSYQDAIYVVLLQCLGIPAAQGSMAKISQPTNPVASLLAENLPAYQAWFLSSRRTRTRIKEGVGLAVAGPPTDPGVVLEDVAPSGMEVIDTDRRIGITEAAELYRKSASVTELAISAVRSP
jgi:hypothetical protein